MAVRPLRTRRWRLFGHRLGTEVSRGRRDCAAPPGTACKRRGDTAEHGAFCKMRQRSSRYETKTTRQMSLRILEQRSRTIPYKGDMSEDRILEMKPFATQITERGISYLKHVALKHTFASFLVEMLSLWLNAAKTLSCHVRTQTISKYLCSCSSLQLQNLGGLSF